MKEGVSVSKGDYLSINDLLELFKAGYLVMRSGHLGNHYFSNLLLYSLGIPCHVFDRNLLLRDTNFHPSCIIYRNQRIKIAKEEEVLVPFAQFCSETKMDSPFVNGSFSPAKVHYDSLKNIFGKDLVWSESDFLFENSELVEKLVTLMAKFKPELFQRVVNSKGETYQNKTNLKNIVQEVLVFNEKSCLKLQQAEVDFSSGIIPSIEVTVLLTTLIGVMTTGKRKVFEISGPSMINYALGKCFTKNINEIYLYLKGKIFDLPDAVEMVVVPSFDFRLGSLLSEKDEMDDLWDNLKKISLLKKEKGEMINNISCGDWFPDVQVDSRLGIIQEFEGKIKNVFRDIASSKRIFERMDFSYKNSVGVIALKNNFFSQYDLIASGEKLYVPEEILSLSMKKVANNYHLIESAQKQFA
ncbi:MAG: hypothetical protein WC682_01920 [Parcubacteria group bacterium]|jgi:hypothetical protein